jgi:hypothetical protein
VAPCLPFPRNRRAVAVAVGSICLRAVASGAVPDEELLAAQLHVGWCGVKLAEWSGTRLSALNARPAHGNGLRAVA